MKRIVIFSFKIKSRLRNFQDSNTAPANEENLYCIEAQLQANGGCTESQSPHEVTVIGKNQIPAQETSHGA